jgi:tetratricopeptide (TPR) repeat protein
LAATQSPEKEDKIKNIKRQEVATTSHAAYQYLEEINRIEKEKGTEFKEFKVGEVQISKNELSLEEFILKGNEHYYNKEYKEAIECYDKALEIDPKHVSALNNKDLLCGGRDQLVISNLYSLLPPLLPSPMVCD